MVFPRMMSDRVCAAASLAMTPFTVFFIKFIESCCVCHRVQVR